jgi:cytochrome c biogenesis protein CcdA/thiol-disulfide isomerase/thioredoxin
MLFLFGAFIAGMLTVLAPCVLPLLPIIIGGSVTGDSTNKRRPLIITAALAVSLFIFTLLLKATTLLINIPPASITYLSGAIIIILGLVTLFPKVYAQIIGRLGIEQRAQKALGKGYNDKRQLIGPIVTGAALGPVFSSCSPVYAYILATVLPANFAQAMAYVICYILGLSVILLAIGFYGQRFIHRIKFAANPTGWFQRTIAVLFIVVGLIIFSGSGPRIQTYVSVHTPFNFDALSSKLLPASKNKTNSNQFNVQPYAAPEFTGIQQWLNGPPQSIQALKGKVVLVDFWTYSCINCIRNNPYLEKWYNTYKSDGFVVVGIHAPEFAFEQVPANVAKALVDQRITYPVGLDNNLATWNAYNNQSWPAGYLIDAQGQVRRIHLGEGEYTQSEQAIRDLLTEKGAKLSKMTAESDAVPFAQDQTPETYLGSDRASNYAGSPALGSAAVATYKPVANLAVNQWSLGGQWEVDHDKIIARSNSTLQFHVSAKNVYLVGGSGATGTIGVSLDGKPISTTASAGSDVQNSLTDINGARLYTLINFSKSTSASTVELTVPDGIELNTFTFGS